MPRLMLDVSKEWVDRFHVVLPSAIDTLDGWENQIRQAFLTGQPEPEDLLDQLIGQITALRRSLEATRLIF